MSSDGNVRHLVERYLQDKLSLTRIKRFKPAVTIHNVIEEDSSLPQSVPVKRRVQTVTAVEARVTSPDYSIH